MGEVSQSKYVQAEPQWPTLPNGDFGDEKHDVLDKYMDSIETDSKNRYDRVDSKLRTLLATNTLAFALLGAFALPGKPIVLVVTVPLLISAMLALRALGVHNFQVVALSAAEVCASVSELKAAVLLGRLASANANASVLDFIVDCFRGAYRYFVVALVVTPFAYLLSVRIPPSPTSVRIEAVDPSVAAAVRGAPGPAGPPGSPVIPLVVDAGQEAPGPHVDAVAAPRRNDPTPAAIPPEDAASDAESGRP